MTATGGCAAPDDESAHVSSPVALPPSSPIAVESLTEPLASLKTCAGSAYVAAFTGTLAEPADTTEFIDPGGEAVFAITPAGAIDQVATIIPDTGGSELIKMEMAPDAAAAYVLTTTVQGAQSTSAAENSLLKVDLADGSVDELAQFDLARHFTVLADGHILVAGLKPGSHTDDGSYDGGPPLSPISFKIDPHTGQVSPYRLYSEPPNGLTASPVEPLVVSSLWMDASSGLVGPLSRLDVSTSIEELLYPESAGTPPGEFRLDNQPYRYHASDISADGTRTLAYGEPHIGPSGVPPVIVEIDVHSGDLLTTSPLGDINPWTAQNKPAPLYTAADASTAATVVTGPDGAHLHTYTRQADGTFAGMERTTLPVAVASSLAIAPCALQSPPYAFPSCNGGAGR